MMHMFAIYYVYMLYHMCNILCTVQRCNPQLVICMYICIYVMCVYVCVYV